MYSILFRKVRFEIQLIGVIMKKHPLIFLMLLLLPLLVFSFSIWALEPMEAQAQMSLTAAGSGVNLGITRLLAEGFSKYNKGVAIDVPGSIGTRGAIKAAADGAIALGLISRSLKEEEKALGLIVHPYARVAIVITANPTVDKHNVLQILLNLITNAKYACFDSDRDEKLITLKLSAAGADRIRMQVVDNGIGILPDNLNRIFQHGFTTRKSGHGFGMHSGAPAARNLGGSLKAHSDGPGCGATFTLELPCHPGDSLS
jgi:hypothetical protein